MTPVIETERLVLRVPVPDDFEAGWAEFHGDAESMKYIGGAMPRASAWRAMAEVVGMWPLRGFGQFSAIEKETGRWVGRVGAWKPGDWPALEVGWMLHRSAWGKGYATEAATACLDFVFGTLGWSSAAHLIHPDNLGSQAVATRLGSRFIDMVSMPPPLDKVGKTQM
jgi:RimJ/RimL family protein N-acetyltransferase